jgi:hypothetical protein
MKEPSIFQNYPPSVTVLSNGLTVSIYALGATIVARLGWTFLVVYLLFLLWFEVNLLAKSCVHCFYYGRRCFSGKGMICSWFFKRGDPAKFGSRQVGWLSLLPDMLITLIPLTIGLVLLIHRFDWIVLLSMVGLVVLAFPGTGFIRGKLACCHCHQRELGCPAEKLFRKRDSNEPVGEV